MSALHIVFDGPPGPEAGRFVEVETPDGHSVNAGEWHERADGLWELQVHPLTDDEAVNAVLGLMEIAEMAMPDTYFQTDSRVAVARNFLNKKFMDQPKDDQ